MDYRLYPWGNAYYNLKSYSIPGCEPTEEYERSTTFYCWLDTCNINNETVPFDEDCFNAEAAPVLCQHGDSECEADRIETCAIHLYPDPVVYSPFVYCLEGVHKARMMFAESCAESSGLDYDALQDCVNSDLADELEAATANATAQLGRSKAGTPWVVVNGAELENTNLLLRQICSDYAAINANNASLVLPAGCP